MRRCLTRWVIPGLPGAMLAAATPARAQSTPDLRRLTLEELINLDLTTVSRVPQAGLITPAAVFVITADDIRRSGVTTLAGALRLAPGVQVTRIDASK